MNFAFTIFTFVFSFVIVAAGQTSPQETAQQLRRFETEWLTANLNDDRSWLSKFSTGKLSVLPGDAAFGGRKTAVRDLTAITLQANEMKVRISGTINLLTNDPKQNRSYFFLDTFNKIGGKWRVIASNISPVPAAGGESREQIEELLRRLENEWARAEKTGDRSALGEILSPDFVSTSAEGKTLHRGERIAVNNADVKSSARTELDIRVPSDSLAIVTGVDTTVRLDRGGKETERAERFTDTWSRDASGRWQCVASHASAIK